MALSGAGSSTAVISDSLNTWPAAAVATGNNSTTGGQVIIFGLYNPITSASYVVKQTGVATCAIMVIAWTGSGGGLGAVDQINDQNTNSSLTTFDCGSVTPLQNGELFIGVAGAIGGTFTSPSITTPASGGVIEENVAGAGGATYGGMMGYYVQATAAPLDLTFSWTGATALAAAVATFELPVSTCNPGSMALSGVGCSIGWRAALIGGTARAIERNEIMTRRRLILPHL